MAPHSELAVRKSSPPLCQHLSSRQRSCNARESEDRHDLQPACHVAGGKQKWCENGYIHTPDLPQ